MNENLGWTGIMSQVLHYLGVVGADRDEEGKFLISNGGVYSFMGMGGENADVVVDGETKYFINGQPAGLAARLGSTSYGMKVHVIS